MRSMVEGSGVFTLPSRACGARHLSICAHGKWGGSSGRRITFRFPTFPFCSILPMALCNRRSAAGRPG